MLRLRMLLLSGLLLSLLPAPASALTFTTMGTFTGFQDGKSYEPEPPSGGAFIAQNPVSGLQKFDPSLGMLEAIHVSAEFDFSVQASLQADGIIDNLADHSASFSPEFDVVIGVGYEPSGGNSTLPLIGFSIPLNVSCFGGPGEPCGDADGDVGSFSFLFSLDVLGDPGLQLADFVGVGDIDTVSAIAQIPLSGIFSLNNVGNAFANLSVNVAGGNVPAGTVKIEYEYSLVPEPSTALLMGGGLLGLLAVTRRAGRAS